MGGHVGDQHRRRRRRDHRHAVVLGVPHALVAAGLGAPRKLHAAPERVRGGVAVADEGEIEVKEVETRPA